METPGGAEAGGRRPARIRVAVVEDDANIARLVRDFLDSRPDFRVVSVTHAEQDFREAVAGHKPDIALIDLGLSTPDSGLELIAWAAREYPATRSVVMTANRDAVARCIALGAAGYYLKEEYDLRALETAVRDAHGGPLGF